MSGYGDDAVSHGVGVCVGVDDDGYVVVDDGVGGDGVGYVDGDGDDDCAA